MKELSPAIQKLVSEYQELTRNLFHDSSYSAFQDEDGMISTDLISKAYEQWKWLEMVIDLYPKELIRVRIPAKGFPVLNG